MFPVPMRLESTYACLLMRIKKGKCSPTHFYRTCSCRGRRISRFKGNNNQGEIEKLSLKGECYQ